MNYILVVLVALSFVSCATNQHAYYYKANVDIAQVPNPEPANGDPYVLKVDDFTGAYNKALSEGYVLLGMSVFQGQLDHEYNALQLAREKGSSLVIKTTRFSHTEYTNYYLPLTTTSTSNTVGYGYARSDVYNRNNSYIGSAYSSAVGTATTTTQNIDWVPMQSKEHIYQQATALFVKSNTTYTLGAYYRDLTIDEQKEMMTNKGVYITHVIKRTPAYDLDLIPGDIILQVNQRRISDVSDLRDFLSAKEEIIEIKVNRSKQLVSLNKENVTRAISSVKESKTGPARLKKK
jgi:hypothetical protein